ncbi:MAG: hypothetical protein IT258_07175 [Saprospiraceae bacterium]|nr:hypothetical protein [Saprospiraceae bacterium]
MTKQIPRWLLVFLLFFNAVGAYFGSYMFITDPSGHSLQVPDGVLNGSIFKDFLIPGIILLLVNGLLPTIAGIGMIAKRPMKALPGFGLLQHYHWAWSLSLISGIGLTVWIAVQIAILGYWREPPFQIIYGSMGAMMTILTLLPSVRQHYKLIE